MWSSAAPGLSSVLKGFGVPRLVAVVLSAIATLFGMAANPAPLSAGTSQSKSVPTSTPQVTFETPRTTVWQGGMQLIPFKVAREAEQRRQIDAAVVAGNQRLAIVRDAEIVKGYDLGFIRVRGKTTGQALLRVGSARIKVNVKRAASHDQISRHRPRVVAPAPGAAVWGKFAVGVQLFDEPTAYPGKPRKVSLLGPKGVTIKRLHSTERKEGPTRLVSFRVDVSKRKPGPITLKAVAKHPAQAFASAVSSQPLVVSVVDTPKDRLVQAEAESHQDVERPERYRQKKPHLGKSDDASGGVYVQNYSSRPTLVIPVKVHKTGWYQLMLRSRGDMAGAAWPTVSLRVDNERRGKSMSRAIGSDWQRNPIGKPIRLEKGEHVLGPRFANDYRRKKDDRNLYIDRYELLRLDAPPPTDAPAKTKAHGDSENHPLRSREGANPDGPVNAEGNPPAPRLRGNDGDADARFSQGHRSNRAGKDFPPPTADLNRTLDKDQLMVAIDNPLDQQTLSGDLTIEGATHWPGAGDSQSQPPTITLRIDGKPVMSQRSARPRFRVSRARFSPGKIHQLQLEARQDQGRTARSPAMHVAMASLSGKARRATPGPRDYRRFTMASPRWVKGVKGELMEHRRNDLLKVRKYYSNGSAELELPEEMSGAYDIQLQARGESYEGPPIARVSLVVDKQSTTIKELPVKGNHRWRHAGTVKLPKGSKRLRISFINDHNNDSGDGDRNLYLQSVSLRQALPNDADQIPPSVKIAYPRAGAVLHGVDAVVSRVADNVAVDWIELMIDGKPTGVRLSGEDGLSKKLLPLVLREVRPGRHRLGVRVRDEAGNLGRSEPVLVNVRASQRSGSRRYRDAVRLLSRLGYGSEPGELADVLTLGRRGYLKRELGHTLPNAGEQNAWEGAVLRYPNARRNTSVTRRASRYLMTTPNPIRARLVMFVDNHFSTWMRKARSRRKAAQFSQFLKLGPAPFADLLRTSAKSPAMLRYLDQYRSYRGRVNENYAREIMELHTLGVEAGYTQDDVVALTHLLTGWTYVDQAQPDGGGGYTASGFRFLPELNDKRPRTVFGLALPRAKPVDRYDRIERVLEMLAAHPSTAKFISTKLGAKYVGSPPPKRLVKELTRRYLESGGDLRALVTHIARSQWLSERQIEPRLSHPVDYAVGLLRSTGGAPTWAVRKFLRGSGVELFNHEMPDGYPLEDPAYADTNAMLQRWRFARRIDWRLYETVPGPLRWLDDEANAHERARWRQRIIDHLAVNMTGYTLSKRSNEAALAMFKNTDKPTHIRIMATAAFIGQLPEANLK